MALRSTTRDYEPPRLEALDATASAHDEDDLDLPPPADRARGKSSGNERDWGGIGALGAGIVIGVLIGAGAALFLAPQTGRALRSQMRRGVRRLRDRGDDAFDALRGELKLAAREKRRALKRRMRGVRYAAEDAVEDVKRKAES